MAFFDTFSVALKQKWLDYYQVNRAWLLLHMTADNTVATPDGGKRPVSYLILGIAAALEPELQQLMLPFSKLKADADSLIEVLGLNFDPDMALGMPSNTAPQTAGQSPTVIAPAAAATAPPAATAPAVAATAPPAATAPAARATAAPAATATAATATAAPAATAPAAAATAPAATAAPTAPIEQAAPADAKSNKLGGAALGAAGVVAGVAGVAGLAAAASALSSEEESLEFEEEAVSDFDLGDDEEEAVS
ncbi:DUF5331 domain-containing protein, partial [Microcoleus sp. SVA1_B6]